MKRANLTEITEEAWTSPHGRYLLHRKAVSLAVGGVKDTGEWGGGHPFDVELARLPAGKSNFPLHYHTAQTEMYLVLAGNALLHDGTSTHPVTSGDVLHFAPGDPHRLENPGPDDLVYLVISDNPKSDVCHYPETGKLLIKPGRNCMTSTPAPYFGPGD